MEDFIQVVAVADYHDFDDLTDSFVGMKLKSYEHGLGDDGRYWGVVFTGRKRKKADILALLIAAGFVPMNDD